MFRIKLIRFYNKQRFCEYKFSCHAFIYGPNTCGKTALAFSLNYILGSSDKLIYQGLDNIDSIEAVLKNNDITLWVKRNILDGSCFYKRTEDSGYQSASLANYKDIISSILTNEMNSHYINVYAKAFEEIPSYRSFSFLNYIEEKGLGDLGKVFTAAKDIKHLFRIKDIMSFFFNFDNIEQLYEKKVLLEEKSNELDNLSNDYDEYQRCTRRQEELFKKLNLVYTGNYDEDYNSFNTFKNSYLRKYKSSSKDLVYLSKVSLELSEEIKLHNFMKNQTEQMYQRREKTKRLLSIFNDIILDFPEYNDYIVFINEKIKQIDKENIFLSSPNYSQVIKEIEKEKLKVDSQIENLKNASTKMSYEDAIKKVGVLEDLFKVLNHKTNLEYYNNLKKEIEILKKEIFTLSHSFDQSKITDFNKMLTAAYRRSNSDIPHVKEDLCKEGFELEFNPFGLCLLLKQTECGHTTSFSPGSMSRQTHLQLLVYLEMFEFLKTNFSGLSYMPLLIIDSANQPMTKDVFEKIYPQLIELAESAGIQTIFLSKDKLNIINEDDFIDISSGLNEFHND